MSGFRECKRLPKSELGKDQGRKNLILGLKGGGAGGAENIGICVGGVVAEDYTQVLLLSGKHV